ncbi:MAG: MarR family transcriptional regulator [Kibdelosporangium sp.]
MQAGSDQGPTGETDVSDATLVRLLRQLTVETDRFAELFGEAHGMHRTDLNALVVVMETARRGGSISPGELARSLHLSASATTAVLDRLEAAGHIRRGRDQNDRRRVELVMSEEALRVGEQFFRPLGVEFAETWRDFRPEQRAAIARFLSASVEATVRVRARLLDQPPGR